MQKGYYDDKLICRCFPEPEENDKTDYVQCKLIKHLGIESLITTSWIPVEYALLNNTIKLKTEHGWDTGWLVFEVYNRKSSEYIKKHKHDYLRTRKASDI